MCAWDVWGDCPSVRFSIHLTSTFLPRFDPPINFYGAFLFVDDSSFPFDKQTLLCFKAATGWSTLCPGSDWFVNSTHSASFWHCEPVQAADNGSWERQSRSVIITCELYLTNHTDALHYIVYQHTGFIKGHAQEAIIMHLSVTIYFSEMPSNMGTYWISVILLSPLHEATYTNIKMK